MKGSTQESASEEECYIEWRREMEAALHSMRLLICDLLRENEEIRTGLLHARSERSSANTGADSSCEDGKADSINRT